MAGNSDMPRTAKSRAGARPASDRKQAGNGSAHSDVMADEIALDALAGHAGYAVRRFQIWIFQDFVRTLAAEHERHVADKIGKENRERLLQILSPFT